VYKAARARLQKARFASTKGANRRRANTHKSCKIMEFLRNNLERFCLRKRLDASMTPLYLGRHSNRVVQVETAASPRVVFLANIANSQVAGAKHMWDTCAVDLRVNLPRQMAAELEEVQRSDPELLSRMVYYAMTRRTIFDYLSTRTSVVGSNALMPHAK
jgi:hypothetical protein